MARKIRRGWFGAVLAVGLLAAGGPAPDAVCDEDGFGAFADSGASTETLLAALTGTDGLKDARGTATSGPVTVCARNDATSSKALADELAGMLKRGADAVRAAGWSGGAADDPLVVVRVRVRGAAPLVLASPDGDALLIRSGEGGLTMTVPVPPSRAEGYPLARDAVVASNRARTWAWAQRSAANAPSLTAILARRVLKDAVTPETRPVWLADAIAAWTETQISPETTPRHTCKPWVSLTAAAIAKWGTDTHPPVGARPVLARVAAGLLAGGKDAGKAVAAFAASSAPLDAAVQEAFGKNLAEVLAAATPPTPGPLDLAPCDEKGVVGCPTCKATGKIELACADCAGSGATCCPSCLGADDCVECTDGYMYYEGGKKVKCRLCTSGKTRCVACAGTLKAPCRSCNATGRSAWPCPAGCTFGRISCPASGAAPDAAAACPWCSNDKLQSACSECGGASFTGCKSCFGTMRLACPDCGGTGETRMVYTDGTTASSSKCDGCGGRGLFKCDKCSGAGKLACVACAGKGRVPRDRTRCALCGGTSKLPEPGWNLLRSSFTPVTKEEAEAHQAMLDRAVRFLRTCTDPSGAFGLRKLRRGKLDLPAQAVEKATIFSNSFCVWTLAIAGQPLDDPALKNACDRVRADAQSIIDGSAEYRGSQAAGLTLRALTAMGVEASSPLVKGLAEKIAKGQHSDGFWGASLDDPKDPSDALDTLIVAESLRLARLRGVKLTTGVWGKLLRAATLQLDSRALSPKNDFLIGTEVASAVALVIMAKEGTLGTKASSFDYESIAGVKRGLAWLDRYFDIAHEPQFAKGARRIGGEDSGYMAWLFSVQRLGMLLSIEEVGGERWYPTASRHLKSIQFKDGSFEERSRYALNGPVRTTCGAILFLLRATPAVTDSKEDD